MPVHIVLEWPRNAPVPSRESVHIRAVRKAGAGGDPAPVQTEARPEGAVLNLSDGVWQVQASVPGYWSQEVELEVSGHAPDDVLLTFWSAASLHGDVVMAEGESLPSTVEVQLTPAPFADSADAAQAITQRLVTGPSRAELHCPIDAGTWNCLGPAGLFDVRLEATGYAPRYAWGVNFKSAESTDFGRMELRKTASVFGRVVRPDGQTPTGPCQANLRPNMARRSPTVADQELEGGPDAKTKVSMPLNRRGYFQIVGVTPGRYGLFVGCQAASAFREISVQTRSEARVDPFPLEELTLDISVAPKLDPTGQPWHLVVDETAPHFLRIANKVTTAVDGRWIRRGLMAGNYHIVVSSSDGTSWLKQYFDLGKSTGPLSLHVAALSVAGRVTTMNSRPVRASLLFTNNAGGASATLMSDDNGRFQGTLPSGVEQSSWTVEAHLVQPTITQRLPNVELRPAAGDGLTWLDLELPANPVHGSVVSPDGKPQPNIQIIVEDTHGTQTTTSTDVTGRFEMPELPLGKYTVIADAYDGSSDRLPFDVTEGGGSELKLVLNPYKRISFLVTSNQGPVADAAVQVWIAPGVPRAFVRSNEDGHFDIALPPETTEVGLTVGAPGYAMKLTRQPIASGGDDPPDAHTINLDTTAGTLVLNFHPPGLPMDNSAMLYLVHNGTLQDARTLAGWGTDQSGVGDNASGNVPVTIDAIEPGEYALCFVADSNPSEVSALWSGSLPLDRCSKGSLGEAETLTLSPRRPPL